MPGESKKTNKKIPHDPSLSQDQDPFEELKLIINKQNDEINQRLNKLDKLESDINEIKNDIATKFAITEQKAQEAIEIAKENETRINEYEKNHELLDVKVDAIEKDTKSRIEALQEEIDELRNRGMRKTLIFRNIPEEGVESWTQTKLVLAREIIKTYKPDSINNDALIKEVVANIDRAHRISGQPQAQDKINKTYYRPIVAEFCTWTYSEKIKDLFIKAKSEEDKTRRVFVSQLVTTSIAKRQKQALIKRAEVLKENKNLLMFVKYPAVLMSKTKGTNEKYKPYEEF